MSCIQMENINEINYLKSVLDRTKVYGIDVSNYYNELDTIIGNYEKHKKSELNIPKDKLHLTVNVNSEYELSINLNFLSIKLNWCVLFLSLMDITENWDLDINIDETFYSIYNNVDKILEYIYDVDIQESIIVKYYDLILKKILKDYKDNKYDYLEEYNDLKKNNYLKNSVMRFLENENIVFNGNIDCYNLKDIIEKFFVPNNNIKEEIVIEEKESKNDIMGVNNNILSNIRKRYFNYICTSILNNIIDIDGNYTKDILSELYEINYIFTIKNYCRTRKNPDLILKDFVDQEDRTKFLNFIGKIISTMYFNLNEDFLKEEKIDFSYLGNFSTMKNFFATTSKVLSKRTFLYGTAFDRILEKDFYMIDFRGIDLSSVDFTGAYFNSSRLNNTRARINPQKVFSLSYCILEGCYVINDFKGYMSAYGSMPYLNGAILVDNFDEILDLEEKLKLGIDERFVFNDKLVSYDEKRNAFVKKRTDVNTSKKRRY